MRSLVTTSMEDRIDDVDGADLLVIAVSAAQTPTKAMVTADQITAEVVGDDYVRLALTGVVEVQGTAKVADYVEANPVLQLDGVDEVAGVWTALKPGGWGGDDADLLLVAFNKAPLGPGTVDWEVRRTNGFARIGDGIGPLRFVDLTDQSGPGTDGQTLAWATDPDTGARLLDNVDASGAPSVVIYNSSGAQSGNRYNTRADLQAAVAAAPYGSPVVLIEQSETLTGGTFDLNGGKFSGGGPDQTEALLVFDDCVITQPATPWADDFLRVQSVGATVPVTTSGPALGLGFGVYAMGSSNGPLIDFTGAGPHVLFLEDARLVRSDSALVADLSPTGSPGAAVRFSGSSGYAGVHAMSGTCIIEANTIASPTVAVEVLSCTPSLTLDVLQGVPGGGVTVGRLATDRYITPVAVKPDLWIDFRVIPNGDVPATTNGAGVSDPASVLDVHDFAPSVSQPATVASGRFLADVGTSPINGSIGLPVTVADGEGVVVRCGGYTSGDETGAQLSLVFVTGGFLNALIMLVESNGDGTADLQLILAGSTDTVTIPDLIDGSLVGLARVGSKVQALVNGQRVGPIVTPDHVWADVAYATVTVVGSTDDSSSPLVAWAAVGSTDVSVSDLDSNAIDRLMAAI